MALPKIKIKKLTVKNIFLFVLLLFVSAGLAIVGKITGKSRSAVSEAEACWDITSGTSVAGGPGASGPCGNDCSY